LRAARSSETKLDNPTLGVFLMANETNQGQQSGGQQQKDNPSGPQQPGQKKPFGEQESQGSEQQRRAPAREQDQGNQGNEPSQRRTPGEGLKEDVGGENERKRA
jgi:hypothetical protein